MKWLKLFLLLSFLCGKGFEPSAQTDLRFESYGMEAGLSQSKLHCLLQDSKGFVWMGTQDGLNKYDGYMFTVYRDYGNDSAILSDKWVYALAEDTGGMLWVGTGAGLNRFNTITLSVEKFLHVPGDENSISSNYIGAICADHAGLIWIGTRTGLDVLDYKRKKINHFVHQPQNIYSLANNNIRCIREDRAGNIWIGTDSGISCLERNTKKFINYSIKPNDPNSLSGNRVNCIYEDGDGIVWIGLGDGGLNRFNTVQKKFTRFKNIPNDKKSLSSDEVRGIAEDTQGILWIATNRGLNLFDKRKLSFTTFHSIQGEPKSIRSDDLSAIIKGKEGLIWIGAHGALHKYNPLANYFIYYKHNDWDTNSLSDNNVWPIVENDKGVLWIGTLGGGLNRFDRINNKWTHYQHQSFNQMSIGNDFISYLYIGKHNKLWITTKAGLDCMDMQTGKFVYYIFNPKDSSGLSGGTNVCQVIEDKAGNIWVGTHNGLNKLDVKTGRFQHFKYDPEDNETISGSFVSCITENKDGKLWVGTFINGLNLYDPATNIFKRFSYNPADTFSLNNTDIYCLHETSDGKIWLGGNKGIDCLDPATGRSIHFRKKNGLPNETIYRIEEDKDGHLWISSNHGMVRMDRKTNQFKYFNTADGLQGLEFDAYSSWHNKRTGEMFFGGNNGFNIFHPDSIRDNEYKPIVFINKLKRFNQDSSGNSKEENMIDKKSITLSYSDNIFSLEFLALSLHKPAENLYAYQLKGFGNDKWIKLGTSREVVFTGLPPGHYTLLVKGANGSGIWNDIPTELAITILPPWYRTWWFYSLCVLAVATIIYNLFRYRLQQKLRILQVRNRLHRDLHDDVGATLSSVKAYSEILRDNPNNPVIAELIKDNSTAMLERLEVIAWATNPQHDNFKSLKNTMIKFAAPLCHAKNMQWVIETGNINEEIMMPGEIRQNIFLVFKESINNMIKYAEATACRTNIFIKNNLFVLQITDNGKGFDGTTKGTGNGWKNMQKRTADLNGKLVIDSKPGQGTTITMNLPYPFKIPGSRDAKQQGH